MKKVAQPIKLLIVNLGIMRWYFRDFDSISKSQFDQHLKQVYILVDMLTIPKLRYNIVKKLNDESVFANEESFIEFIKYVENLATDICGISEENLEDSFMPFWKVNKDHASELYLMNTAPKVMQAYEAFNQYNSLLIVALENDQ